MKIRFFTLLVLFGSVCSRAFSFCGNYIEFDLNKGQIKLADFSLGRYSLSGDFSFASRQEKGVMIYELEGRNVVLGAPPQEMLSNFGNKVVPWLKVRLKRSGEILFIENFSLPNVSVKGNYDLTKSDFFLDISGRWDEDSPVFNGYLNVFAKAWGNKDKFLISGHLTMDNYIYKDREFSHIRLNFLGKPPILNIIDSKFILANGTIAAIDGEEFLDLRNFSNLIPGAEYKVSKAFFDEWQIYSEGKDTVSLKKNIDENVDVYLGVGRNQTSSGPQTELRYEMTGESFLKLKMQENNTLAGIEKRKNF